MTEQEIRQYLDSWTQRIDEMLEKILPREDEMPSILHRAMRYAVFPGGKRLRPVLSIATCEVMGRDGFACLPTACAIELVHSYSLIHDDLPCMDNDDYRRGKPSCHMAFGEAMAILAGDALLSLSFEVASGGVRGASDLMERWEVAPDSRLRTVAEIARASGSIGMVGGQVADLHLQKGSQGRARDVRFEGIGGLDVLDWINLRKTAALFECALRCGAIIGGANDDKVDSIGKFGRFFGLAFQIMDDIKDFHKTDSREEELSYPSFIGKDKALSKVHSLVTEAEELIKDFGSLSNRLAAIASFALGV